MAAKCIYFTPQTFPRHPLGPVNAKQKEQNKIDFRWPGSAMEGFLLRWEEKPKQTLLQHPRGGHTDKDPAWREKTISSACLSYHQLGHKNSSAKSEK